MQVKDLRANKKNPRKISPKKLENLKKSVNTFGDLGCIVFNKRSGNLVSGHQRAKTFPANTSVKITQKFDTPNSQHTVAEGYIEHNGERYKYREVDVSDKIEAEMLLAANNQGGENDDDLLKVLMADFPDMDVDLSGLDIEMPTLRSTNVPDEKPASKSDENEETDAQYLKNNPGPDQEVDKEKLPSLVNSGPNPFDKVEEKMNVVGKRFVIIIDCKDEEMKKSLKEKLLTTVKESGANFF